MPLHYISGVAATAAWLLEDIPSMSEPCPTEPKPEPCGLLAPGPSRVLTPSPGTSPPLVSSIPDIPLFGTPLVGHPFPFLSTTFSWEKWDHSPHGSPDCPQAKRTWVTSPKAKVGSKHSSTWGDDHMPNLTPETELALCNKDERPPALSPVPLQG